MSIPPEVNVVQEEDKYHFAEDVEEEETLLVDAGGRVKQEEKRKTVIVIVRMIVVLLIITVVLSFNSFRLSSIVFTVAALAPGLGLLTVLLVVLLLVLVWEGELLLLLKRVADEAITVNAALENE